MRFFAKKFPDAEVASGNVANMKRVFLFLNLSRLLEQVHLPVVQKSIEQAGVFEFVFAVSAQRDEFRQFEREEKILDRFAGPGAFGEVAVRLRATNAVGKFIGIAKPATHLSAVLSDGQFQGGVEVGGGDDFGAVLAFKYFEFHKTLVLMLLLLLFQKRYKNKQLVFKNKLLDNIFLKNFLCLILMH